MHLYALDQHGRTILAKRAEKKADYFCLECNALVRLRGGEWRQPHFYHLQRSTLCRQNGKGLIHLQIQKKLLALLPSGEAELERRFPQIQRVADVCWSTQQLIFEIQYSAITAEEVEQRNLSYNSLGYRVVWILHDDRFNKRRLTSAEEWLQDHCHYFTNIDAQGNGVIYDQTHVIKGSYRSHFSNQFAVRLNAPLSLLDLRELQLPLLQKRQQNWQIAFDGDLLARAWSGLLDAMTLQFLQHETSLTIRPWRKKWGHFWEESIVRRYRTVFRYLLEATTD